MKKKAKEKVLPIGEKEVVEAAAVLMKYREEKASIDSRIKRNEEFWKLNHWEVMEGLSTSAPGDLADKRIKPKSAWLFNTIMNKHADSMDNFPEANILPRSRDDEEIAKTLSMIIPVILEQNDYDGVYSDVEWYKQKNGTGVTGVFWNGEKDNGLGNVDIRKIDLLNLFWKGGIKDIQQSPNVFYVQMMDNDEIAKLYPEIRIGASMEELQNDYKREDSLDKSNMSAIVDWYYKKIVRFEDENGIQQVRTLLHYCKFCNGQVIYASENDANYEERGFYDHGLYPFVTDVLFPVEESICGMGYIDILQDDQLFIDKLDQGIMENGVSCASPRWIVKDSSGINEQELLDTTKRIIHASGNIGEDTVRALNGTPLPTSYENIRLQKIQEMKDTSGNTASSQGQASSVTSASGIASLQEAAGKLSRDANGASYRSFKKIVNLVIELIRQFYTEPRCFRITGEDGRPEYVTIDNSALSPVQQGEDFGLQLGSRKPIMDIDVKPQKKNAYSKESQNQTALNLYGMGFFAPTNADSALACLEMMDFDGIEKMREKIGQNGTLAQMVMQLQQQNAMYAQMLIQAGVILDAQNGTNIAGQVASQAQSTQEQTMQQLSSGQRTKGGTDTSRGSLSSQAANTSRASTSPR